MNANNITDTNEQTIGYICEQRGISPRSLGVTFRRKFGTGYSVHLVPNDEQFAVLFGNIKTRKQQPSPKTGAAIIQNTTRDISGKTQAPKAAPVKKAVSMQWIKKIPAFDVLLRWGIVGVEMLLMCYSMNLLFSVAGIIAGTLIAMFTLQGMILAGKPNSWMSSDIFMFGYFVFCSFGVYLNKQTFTQTFSGAAVDGSAEYLMWALSSIVGFAAYMSAWTSKTVTNETAE